jgi:hypothetical protein
MRFSEDFEDTDTALIKECLVRQESFPIGTHSISLGNIAQGKWLLVKPVNDLQIKLDTGSNQTLRGGKISKMWVNFTALEITVSTAAQVVVLVVAGE